MMNTRLHFSAFALALLIPTGFALAQTPPTAAAPNLSNNSAWPRSNCSQLLLIGAPSPAWISAGSNPPKTDALLTLINYQMALNLCQQEQFLSQLQEQIRVLKNLDNSTARTERLHAHSKDMDQKRQETLDTLVSEVQKLVTHMSAAPSSTTAAAPSPTAPTNSTPLPAASASPVSTPVIAPTVITPAPLAQDTQIPQLERTLLRLIDVLSQQVQQNAQPPVSAPALPAPPAPIAPN